MQTMYPVDKPKKIARYTLSIFLERALCIHGESIDYSQVKESDIKNSLSDIPLKCNKCGCNWRPTIKDHIQKESGCPRCGGRLRWTITEFIMTSTAKFPGKYDYSLIVDDGLTNVTTKVPLICLECGHRWSPTINDHINGKNGCPGCSGNVRWTYDRFIVTAKEIHGDKYNYELVTPESIENCRSKIPLICNDCFYQWTPTINSHIHSRSGCPDCGGKVRWNYDRFILKAHQTHGDRYNYDLVTIDDVQCALSHITIKCNKCTTFWRPTIVSHINQKSGCPKCSRSRGEIQCCVSLSNLGLTYDCQYSLESLPRKRYDVFFSINDVRYLIEFDGTQHFEYDNFFHRTVERYEKRRQTDIDKTYHARINGLKLIRIDYSQLNKVSHHINLAIKLLIGSVNVYYSDIHKYLYIINGLRAKLQTQVV
jgi:predicted Zn-ribbon and HTH transcriptional regulator